MGDVEEFASIRREIRVLGEEFEAAGFVEEVGGGGGEDGEESYMGGDGERRRGHDRDLI